jgi:subtilisin family serine protease
VDDQSRLYPNANRGAYVAVAAPGVDVLAAAPGGAYDLTSGTSVACAEVSGIAALLLEKNPGLDGPALRKALRATARSLKDAPEAGAGLVDAEAALQAR